LCRYFVDRDQQWDRSSIFGNDCPRGDDAFFHLGVAISRLHALRELVLDVSVDGADFGAIGRGMVEGAGGVMARCCPALWRLRLWPVLRNAEMEPCVIVPSVRVVELIEGPTRAEALVLCGALLEQGYRHCLCIEDEDGDVDPEVLRCMTRMLRPLRSVRVETKSRLEPRDTLRRSLQPHGVPFVVVQHVV
jgi:hypothetical protein